MVLKYMAKLWEPVPLILRMNEGHIDIGPEMLPIRVIALQICASEKVFNFSLQQKIGT